MRPTPAHQPPILSHSNAPPSQPNLSDLAIPVAGLMGTAAFGYDGMGLEERPPPYVPGTSAATAPEAVVGAPTQTTKMAPIKMPGLGRQPTGFRCPHCHQEQVTVSRNIIDACTVVAVLVLLVFFWPLFWIPLCTTCCKTTEHYCGRCNEKVREMGPCEQ